MEWVIVGSMLVIFLLLLSGASFSEDNTGLGVGSLLLGTLMLAVVVAISADREGIPRNSIAPGAYSISFIEGINGTDKVNLILSWESAKDKTLVHRFYQFPISAFEQSQVNVEGKKLIVVESGEFKKFRVE